MPEPLIHFVLLLLIPGALVSWLAVRRHATRVDALLAFAFTGLLVAFLYQWGQYPYVGSYYLRFGLPVLTLVAGIRAARSVRDRPWHQKPDWRSGLVLGFQAAGSAALITLTWMALQARSVEATAVDMEFPLRGGTYYISTGGSNGVLNLHHKAHTPGQWYAIDVDRLDRWGRYAGRLLPRRVSDFLIHGDTVYSPCDCRVIDVEDGVRDNVPFEYDPETASGNHVRLERDDLRVALMHLAPGSVLVRPGDRVAAGDPVGRVGNSGFSTQPHLHMQVSRAAPDSTWIGVPVRFRGRFLARNDRFTN